MVKTLGFHCRGIGSLVGELGSSMPRQPTLSLPNTGVPRIGLNEAVVYMRTGSGENLKWPTFPHSLSASDTLDTTKWDSVTKGGG